jgi:hypothetical protein
MAEWPRILEWYSHRDHETYTASVIPADLGRELSEAARAYLRDSHLRDQGCRVSLKPTGDRLRDVLARYEREVGK